MLVLSQARLRSHQRGTVLSLSTLGPKIRSHTVCPTATVRNRSSQLLGSASVLPDHRVSHPLGLQDPRIRASIRREALGNKRLMYDRRGQTESFWTFLNYPTVTSMWLMCWMQRTQPCLPKKRVGILSDVWNQDLADGTSQSLIELRLCPSLSRRCERSPTRPHKAVLPCANEQLVLKNKH